MMIIPDLMPLALMDLGSELLALIPLVHLAGFFCAYRAIMHTRTPQGAIAWSVSLVVFPYLSVPFYVIFGRRKFHGYVNARRAGDLEINHIGGNLRQHLLELSSDEQEDSGVMRSASVLAKMPFTCGNSAELLIDGDAIFDSIIGGMEEAKHYILVQFYIVRDDQLGRRFKDCLIAKSRAGVRVNFLYDEIGCYGLSGSYLDSLTAAGVHVHPFLSTRGPNNRFQINFRNHRKIVVVDGDVAWVGGSNVGDEYMGLDPKIGPWRDTQCRMEGPVVKSVQLAFLEDWYFATCGMPDLDWLPKRSAKGEMDVLALPSGPADSQETAGLFFVSAINAAVDRVWIASPYFVPDDRVVGALQLAALRGVDVRILLPAKPDQILVYLSSFSYLDELCDLGVRFYQYTPGFLHEKTMLVDDCTSVVGTANLDNRSFRLNFEISMVFVDRDFARQMEDMFEADFARSKPLDKDVLDKRSNWFRFLTKLSRLLAPIQ
ncbi:MAG: cardiolipin synthase [Planctomycetota bacterium]|jgi:cardiolipin synthase